MPTTWLHDHCLGHRNWGAGQELPCAIIVMANPADGLMLLMTPTVVNVTVFLGSLKGHSVCADMPVA